MSTPVQINPALIALIAQGGGGGGGGTYGFNRSLRFRATASARVTPSARIATTGATKFTISLWARLTYGAVGGGYLLGVRTNAEGEFLMSVSSGKLNVRELAAGVATTNWSRSCNVARFTDGSAHHHCVVAYDSTLATASDRVKIWIDGTQETSFQAPVNPALNLATQLGAITNPPPLGGYNSNGSLSGGFWDGQISGVHILDGIAATAADFGELSGSVWVPKRYTGSYGPCGSQLLFGDASTTTTLVADTSGNARTWTATNISVSSGVTFDQMLDVPYDEANGGTGLATYPILNSDNNTGPDPVWAGLRATFNASSGYANSTQGMDSGIWYAEATVSAAGFPFIGIANAAPGSTYVGGDANSWAYGYDGKKYTNGVVGSAYGASYTNGDVIGILFNRNTGALTFYKNNVSQGTAYTGLTSGTYYFAVGAGGTSPCVVDVNFGQRPFAYSIPSGALALNTLNN